MARRWSSAGDFATTRVEGAFTLVYLVYNTIMNLTSQDEQVACFRNAADHLAPGGCFVIEVVVPDLRRLYVWPSELDLMAQLAGLTRRERWAGWRREPFNDESPSHVSVWQKAG